MDQPFVRTEMLFGRAAMERLAASRVAVFGVGGVGGYAVEGLARSGVGALDLIDSDVYAPSNLNRQLHALRSTLGLSKVEAAQARIRDINPDCRVTVHQCFFLPENRDAFDFTQYDYVVDAIDTVAGKLALIECAREASVPIISAMGAGNKLDPTAFRVADIYETSICPLAKVMRVACRKRGIDRLKVVYSTEPPLRPLAGINTEPSGLRRDTPGSTAFVPSVVGLIIAGEVVKDLTRAERAAARMADAPATGRS